MNRLPRSMTLGALALGLALVGSASGSSPTWTAKWRLIPRESGGFYGSNVLALTQKRTRVTGTFAWQFVAEHGFGAPACRTGHGGTLTGTIVGRTLRGSMVYPRRDGHPASKASLTAILSVGGREISGRGEMLTGECGGGVFYAFRARRVTAPR